MSISTGLESEIRSAILHRLRLSRVPPVPQWDDEAVTAISEAARRQYTRPSGMVTADGPEAAAAIAAVKERAEGMTALAYEMLAVFSKGTNGWSARVKADQVEQWRERLGASGDRDPH